jgi:hypothetical protein
MTRLTITKVRDILRACSSETVWIVHNGRRFPLHSFEKLNFSWSGWCYQNSHHVMRLFDMLKALKKRDNWVRLQNYSLTIRIEETDTWVNVFRIEETRGFYATEDDIDLEDIEGEVLIHVHNEEDVLREYEEKLDKPE